MIFHIPHSHNKFGNKYRIASLDQASLLFIKKERDQTSFTRTKPLFSPHMKKETDNPTLTFIC